jgi:hypothetical protein
MARWSRFLGPHSRDGRQERATRRRSDDAFSDAAVPSGIAARDEQRPASLAVGRPGFGMPIGSGGWAPAARTAMRRLGLVGSALMMVALAGTLVGVEPAAAGRRGDPVIEGLSDVGGTVCNCAAPASAPPPS